MNIEDIDKLIEETEKTHGDFYIDHSALGNAEEWLLQFAHNVIFFHENAKQTQLHQSESGNAKDKA